MAFNNTKTDITTLKVERVTASVKWYNPIKGYGFLTSGSTPTDIMIHFSALDAIKCPYIKLGDEIICEVVSGKSGLLVSRVLEVKFGSLEERSLKEFYSKCLPSCNPETLEELKGTIKWFNPDKGYGFISPDIGSREVFLHYSVVRAAGYKTLSPGVRVLVKVSISEQGPDAHVLRALSESEGDNLHFD